MSRKKNLKHEIWWNVYAVMKRLLGNCLTNTLCICTIKRDEMTCVYDLCDTGCILETASYVFGVWSQGWGFGWVESIAMQNAHLNKLNHATCITNLSRPMLFVSCDVYYIYIYTYINIHIKHTYSCIYIYIISYNVGKNNYKPPIWDGLYQLLMVIWVMGHNRRSPRLTIQVSNPRLTLVAMGTDV